MANKQKEQLEISTVSTATAAVQLQADGQVALWRIAQLQRSGYSETAAARIGAWGHIDLHLAVTIREQGCPEETALKILL